MCQSTYSFVKILQFTNMGFLHSCLKLIHKNNYSSPYGELEPWLMIIMT